MHRMARSCRILAGVLLRSGRAGFAGAMLWSRQPRQLPMDQFETLITHTPAVYKELPSVSRIGANAKYSDNRRENLEIFWLTWEHPRSRMLLASTRG